MENSAYIRFVEGGKIVKHTIKGVDDHFFNVVTYVDEDTRMLKSVRLVNCRVEKGICQLEGCNFNLLHLSDMTTQMIIKQEQ